MTTKFKTIRFSTNTSTVLSLESRDDQVILCENSSGNILGAFAGFKGMQHELTSNGTSYSATESWTRLNVQPEELVQSSVPNSPNYLDYFVDPQNRYVHLQLPNVTNPLIYLGSCTQDRTLFVELNASSIQPVTLVTSTKTAVVTLASNFVMTAQCNASGQIAASVDPVYTLTDNSGPAISTSNAFYKNSDLTVLPISAGVSEFYYVNTSADTSMSVQFTVNGTPRRVGDGKRLSNNYKFKPNVWYNVRVGAIISVVPLTERHAILQSDMSSVGVYTRYNLFEKIIYDFPEVDGVVRLQNDGAFTKPVRFGTRASSISLLFEAVQATAFTIVESDVLDINRNNEASILGVFTPLLDTSLPDNLTTVTLLDWSGVPAQAAIQDGIDDFLTIDLGLITAEKRIEFTSPTQRSILFQAVIGNTRQVVYRNVFANSTYVINATLSSLTVTGTVVPDVIDIVTVPQTTFTKKEISFYNFGELNGNTTIKVLWATNPTANMMPATVTLCTWPSMTPFVGATDYQLTEYEASVNNVKDAVASYFETNIFTSPLPGIPAIPPGTEFVGKITLADGSIGITDNRIKTPGKTLGIDVTTKKAAASGIDINFISTPVIGKKLIFVTDTIGETLWTNYDQNAELGSYNTDPIITGTSVSLDIDALVPGTEYMAQMINLNDINMREKDPFVKYFSYSAAFNTTTPRLTVARSNTVRASWDISPVNAWVTVDLFKSGTSGAVSSFDTQDTYLDFEGIETNQTYSVNVRPFGSPVTGSSNSLTYTSIASVGNMVFSSRSNSSLVGLQSGSQWVTDATRPSQVLSIASGSYASINSINFPAAPASLTMWVKVAAAPTGSLSLLRCADATNSFIVSVGIENSSLACSMGKENATGIVLDLDDVGFTYNNYCHIALVNNGLTMCLYVNAVIVDTQVAPPMIGIDSTSNFRLGDEQGSRAMYFDDVRVYSKELLASDVNSIFLGTA